MFQNGWPLFPPALRLSHRNGFKPPVAIISPREAAGLREDLLILRNERPIVRVLLDGMTSSITRVPPRAFRNRVHGR